MLTLDDTAVQPEVQPVVVARPQTVLIIDDDEALSDVLSRRLKQQGFRAVTADCGELGLARAKAELPAAIVLDLCLPDSDGFSICERLADAPETCSIPVIILSGLGRPDVLRRCRAAGGHFFLRKPYDPNTLLVLIRQAIQDAGALEDGLDEDRT